MAENFTPDNKENTQIAFGLYTAFLFLASAIGFLLMGNQGLFTDNKLVGFYILYIVLNATYIGFSGVFLFMKDLSKNIFVYLHNYEFSWLANNGIITISKTSFYYKVFNNFFYSLLLWHVILSPLLLLQYILPRETALLFMPVSPQVVFPFIAVTTQLFFTIFPASTGETGILAMINSLTATWLFKNNKNKRVAIWLMIFLIPILSGFIWLFVHGFVAQGQELNQRGHYAFGVEQGFLMVLTGSIAGAIALHNLNLLFYAISDIAGQYEFLRIAFPVTILIVWVGTIWLISKLRKKR